MQGGGTQVVLSGVLDVRAAKAAGWGKISTEKLPTRCSHLCQYLRSCFGLPSQLKGTYLHDDDGSGSCSCSSSGGVVVQQLCSDLNPIGSNAPPGSYRQPIAVRSS